MAFIDAEVKIREPGAQKVDADKLKSKEIYTTNNNTFEKKTEEPWKGKSLYRKILYIKSNITVEPILAFYVMPSVLVVLATQNLYLEKACRVNLGYSDHICDALTRRDTSNYTYEEGQVQKLVASVTGWKTALQSFLPCATILFLGSYSDRIGRRKFCMLLPIVGEFLTSVGMIVNNYYFYELPIEVAAVTEAIFPALCGGWFTMFMAVFSYMADVTSEEQRTVRIGILNMFYSLGVPIGSGLSGILLREIGFYGVYSMALSFHVLSFSYCFFVLKDVKKVVSYVDKSTNCCQWLGSIFDIRLVKEAIQVAFKKGPNHRRLRVAMLFIVLCVVVGPNFGEIAVMYLFTRFRFNWDEVDYSIFSTYMMCTSLAGSLFALSVFSHMLKMDDAIVGVIASTSKIMGAFMYAFATTKWQMYIGPLLDLFNGTAFIAMRSMVSKLVSSDELGKVNSLFGVAESMMPLVYAPMYTSVYSATLDVFPGAFFLVGALLTTPSLVIFGWLHFVTKKDVLEISTDKLKNADFNTEGIVNKAYEIEEKKSNENENYKSKNVEAEETDLKFNNMEKNA